MTLGPALCILAALDGRTPAVLRPLLTFGRVPLFYYLVHLTVIHLLAVVVCYLHYGDAHWMFESPRLDQFPFTRPPGWGFSLPTVYLIWAGVVAAMYPLCARVARQPAPRQPQYAPPGWGQILILCIGAENQDLTLCCGRRGGRIGSAIMRIAYRLVAAIGFIGVAVAFSFAPARMLAQSGRPAGGPFDALRFRDIGPAATGGRIHDLQIDPKNPAVLYAGTASGGIWKSTNNGVTWKDVFGTQPDNTFGALAIFERDTKIVWAGTGENNNRQSSSWGGGVYRSTDGGDTWTYLGLHETRAIGRVVLDPADPNVAYVAAVGNLWTENPERGVFKTTDAGRTWSKVLFVDAFTGATDLVMDPRDPKVLYAATYQRLRKAFGFNGGGPGSAIYKSVDAGATWKKLENGIPTGDKGRIGLALARSKPDVLIATIEHATAGGTYRTEDAGATWKRMSATNPRPMYLQQADHRSQQRQAHLASGHLHRQERGWRHDLRGGADVANLRRRSEDGSPRASRRSRRTRATSTSSATAGCTRASTWERPTSA